MKASPLLRAWLARLAGLGVALRPRHRWRGWDEAEGAPVFDAPEGRRVTLRADAVVLALGGRLLAAAGIGRQLAGAAAGGIRVAPLRPANCGFLVDWSEHLRARFAGTPLKRIALSFAGRSVRGEAVVTAGGIEGGAVYALSAPLREAIARDGGAATLWLDLRPDLDAGALAARGLDAPGGGLSLSNCLRRAGGFPPVAVALVQEARRAGDARPLSALVKALPLRLTGTPPIERAISSAGGIAREELDARFMLRRCPGVFAAGEMLDWEAPTGGYLLQACFATGVAAGEGALAWIRARR
jgi:uncharacterized flavoprotein (TIGR03862 family)